MKILLAINISESFNRMVDHLAAQPWPSDTEVCVLHVIDQGLISSHFLDVESYSESEARAAQTFMNLVAERIEALGIKARATVVEGHAKTTIVEHAAKWGADLILIGSHDNMFSKHILLGSIARYVIRHAPCSVQVVREPHPRPHDLKIIVATDGSESALEAARAVAQRPWPAGAQFKVISAVNLMMPSFDPWYAAAEIRGRIEEKSFELAQEAITTVGHILENAGLEVTSELMTGNPKIMIVDEANRWGADLIVTGSYGLHSVSRILLGSVSETVAMQAPCSVAVMRNRNWRVS